MKPFHLSFVVPSLDEAKVFYTSVLECSLGRDKGSWIDILFFGHQVTIHQASDHMKAKPLDHFGPILEKEAWQKIAARCKSFEINFVMQPTLKNEGEREESGKFMVLDPAGNVVEFKYYKSFETTVRNNDS